MTIKSRDRCEANWQATCFLAGLDPRKQWEIAEILAGLRCAGKARWTDAELQAMLPPDRLRPKG